MFHNATFRGAYLIIAVGAMLGFNNAKVAELFSPYTTWR